MGENPWNNGEFSSTALINITVDGKTEMTAAEGDGSEATFYADKDLIVPVLTMIAPILKPMVPDDYEEFIR